jgi:hypothetical protein
MIRALALIDKPSAASFGMTPIVLEDNGNVRVLGLAPASAPRGLGVTKDEVQELIRGGHALSADDAALSEQIKLSSDTVALWLGDAFADRASKLGLPHAPLPAFSVQMPGGRFFLGPAASMYPYLERWTIAAFRRFRDVSDLGTRKEIASLMRWVLPNRPESLAAAWSTSPDPERELQLQLRTFARGQTPKALRAEHERRLVTPPDELAELRLVVFTGGTETGRNDTGGLYCYAISGDVSHGEHQALERLDGPPSRTLNLSRIITDQSDGKVVFKALEVGGISYHWERLLCELAAKQTLRIEAGQRVVVRLAYLGKEPRGVSVHLYG